MDDGEKIIRENYPVERLPADLRAGLDEVARVRVTIEVEETAAERRRKAWERIDAHVQRARSAPGFQPVSVEDTGAWIGKLRDEWDH